MTAAEKHFTVKEIAEAWNLSENTVIAMFRDQPGDGPWCDVGTRLHGGGTA